MDPVMMRLLASARRRWPCALALPFLLLIAAPGPLAARDFPWCPPLPSETAPVPPAQGLPLKASCPAYRLLPDEPCECGRWPAFTGLTAGSVVHDEQTYARELTAEAPKDEERKAEEPKAEEPKAEEPKAEEPKAEEARKPNHLLGALIPVTTWGLVAANSLLGYHNRSFHVHHEGWFGANTRDGGADKASHFADYYIVSKEIAFVYRALGYSDNAALWLGFGVATVTGLVNEASDGTTKYGFSWEDLAMDTAGAGTAALLSATRTEDLLGIRTSHVPSSTYTHDVYSADVKLSGLGRRLGVNLGPLRWLLFSVTYGTKGYRVTPPIEQQRQVGFEIGLNLDQILVDLRVTRATWWGWALHLVGDNVRFPYTALGMRYDMNHGKWHGPNAGNFD